MMLVRMNHRELTTESKRTRLSIIRFCGGQHARVFGQTTHLAILLQEHLIIFAQGDAEYDGRDIFKAVDPLLALASLATDVKHAVQS